MGKESKKATQEMQKLKTKSASRVPKVITDAVIRKLLRKRYPSARITKSAVHTLKALMIARGVHTIEKANVIRVNSNMQTLMDSHMVLAKRVDDVNDMLFRQMRKKRKNVESLA